jgi:hypothetical protein
MIMYGEHEATGEELVADYCKVLPHFPGGTKENHEYQWDASLNTAWADLLGTPQERRTIKVCRKVRSSETEAVSDLKKCTDSSVDRTRNRSFLNRLEPTFRLTVAYCTIAGVRSLSKARDTLLNLVKAKYLGTAVKYQNFIHEEIDIRLNSGSSCYPSAANLMSCRLLSTNAETEMYFITIVLRVVLHGCGNWSLTLREGHRLWVFENRRNRGLFGSKTDDVIWGWRKPRNKLHNLLSWPNIITIIKSRRMRWAGHVASMGNKKCV